MKIISLYKKDITSMRGIFDEFPVVSENQITLRKAEKQDAEDLVDLYDFPMKTETVRRMIRDYEVCYEERKEVLLVFAWKERVQGVLELYHFEGDACELGYRTCLHGRGHGITKKAVGILLKALKYTELHKLYARCEQNHHASRCILEDNGFRLMKTEDQKNVYVKEIF